MQEMHSVATFSSIIEVREFLDQKISELDVELFNAPYTQAIYHPWRKNIFQNYLPLKEAQTERDRNIITYQLVQIIDEEYLTMFQMFLQTPFKDLVLTRHYHVPENVDLSKYSKNQQSIQAFDQMISNIAEWNIQIERVIDTIDRVQFYRLWNPKSSISKVHLNVRLKSILQPQNTFSYNNFSKHVFLTMIAKGASSLGDFVYNQGFKKSNVSFIAMTLLYNSMAGGTQLPWQMIASQIKLPWILGSVVGYFSLDKLVDYINTQESIGQLLEIAGHFRHISLELVTLNEALCSQINNCLLTVSEEEEHAAKAMLAEMIDKFLEDPEEVVHNFSQLLQEQNKTEEDKDDWTVVDKKFKNI